MPQLGSGDPLQVLLHFPDRALLRTCTRLEGSHAYFVTGPERSLEIMQRITLHLQLPLGFFITLAGRVRESTDHHCVIAAHRVNHSLLANLRMALGLTPEE